MQDWLLTVRRLIFIIASDDVFMSIFFFLFYEWMKKGNVMIWNATLSGTVGGVSTGSLDLCSPPAHSLAEEEGLIAVFSAPVSIKPALSVPL